LEEDLHNITLQEDATRFEMVVARRRSILLEGLESELDFSGSRRVMRDLSSFLTS
jgi:hypothetical protein